MGSFLWSSVSLSAVFRYLCWYGESKLHSLCHRKADMRFLIKLPKNWKCDYGTLVCVVPIMFCQCVLYLFTDGHLKLVRWRLITHCSIGGYSRAVVYLRCSSNSRSDTVMQLFLEAIEQFGIPSRVRSDQGGRTSCFVLSTLDSIVAVCWWVVQSTKDRTSL